MDSWRQRTNRYFGGLSKNTFFLAFASLFSDISTEMLYPVLPVYLTQTLKANGSVVGLIEGIATATQFIIQGFSGWLSDHIRKRKPVALAGYLFGALSKPLIGLAPGWQGVLGARFLDRLGAGTRSAPRDGLIAASASEDSRGKAFGLEGIGDNLGAFLGPLITVFLLFSLHIQTRSIFFLAVIPGLLAFFMIFLVREKAVPVKSKSTLAVPTEKFPKSYWTYLAVTAVFGIGNSSNAFLLLQMKNLGISLETTILIYAVYNLVAALISYPAGMLSDRFGRKNILAASFIIFILTYLGFTFTNNIITIGVLFILYGLYQGIFRAVGKALASDFVPQSVRASGIGWYSTTIGLTGLVASLVAGKLWDSSGHVSVFLYGVVFAGAGLVSLLLFVRDTHARMVKV